MISKRTDLYQCKHEFYIWELISYSLNSQHAQHSWFKLLVGKDTAEERKSITLRRVREGENIPINDCHSSSKALQFPFAQFQVAFLGVCWASPIIPLHFYPTSWLDFLLEMTGYMQTHLYLVHCYLEQFWFCHWCI